MKKILLREPYQSRYKRWEDKRIEQFGFANNLLIGLASVLLFWMLQGAIEGNLVISNIVFWLVILSGISFFLSLSCGLLLTYARLKDFRETTNLISKENKRAYFDKKNDLGRSQQLGIEIELKQKENKKLGEWSWRLLYTEGLSFVAGFLLLGVGVLVKIIGY